MNAWLDKVFWHMVWGRVLLLLSYRAVLVVSFFCVFFFLDVSSVVLRVWGIL